MAGLTFADSAVLSDKSAGSLGDSKPTELTDRQPTMADVRRGFRGRYREFECLRLAGDAVEILHAVPVDQGWLIVIGDTTHGDCEWVYVETSGKSYIDERGFVPRLEKDEAWSHSDEGFGTESSALLDGLLKIEGGRCIHCGCCLLPPDSELVCSDCADDGYGAVRTVTPTGGNTT